MFFESPSFSPQCLISRKIPLIKHGFFLDLFAIVISIRVAIIAIITGIAIAVIRVSIVIVIQSSGICLRVSLGVGLRGSCWLSFSPVRKYT